MTIHSDQLGIRASWCSKVSFAFHQNSIPVLMELKVVNNTLSALEGVSLTLTCEPGFISPKSWLIEQVQEGQTYSIEKLDVNLNGSFLGRLTEAEKADVTLTLRSGDETLVTVTEPIELLARNQWGGIGEIPELLSAFIQPNDPFVDRIIRKAADVLRQQGKDPTFDGYKAGTKKRVWEQASGIWNAICSFGFEYALPPQSFESHGQKIRSPSQILDGGVATCLDSSLLFAAALEQAGLNPLIVITSGHTFVGCWLVAESFSTAIDDDVTALRKRVKLGELVLFETTLALQRPAASFKAAAERADFQISESEEDNFELVIDVRRTRLQRILPLANADAIQLAALKLDEVVEPAFFEPPEFVEMDVTLGRREGVALGRLDRWQRKLLDLSLRNSLLNFKAVKRSIVLIAPNPALLEDRLAQGATLKLLACPAIMEGSDPRNAAIHMNRHQEDARAAMSADALARNELFVDLGDEEASTRLTELYRTAKAELQEGGSNTLYLALGFLVWQREDKDKPSRAPLILVPVTLDRKSVRSGFLITLHDDEARFNLTLLEMLSQDFGLSIPRLAGTLPTDEAGLDVNLIWRVVRETIKDIRGWEVTEDVILSTFSFAKYLMWKDLVDRTDQLKANPVVKHLLETPRELYESAAPFPDPRSLDATYNPEQIFCPVLADSSQLTAVMAAANGKDFVLRGPPGTGKSQTITNMIAQSLAQGKSVLFVAEKTAALDVVYRRLKEVGLGEFCLELHSNKARKLDVLSQLQRAWSASGQVDHQAWLNKTTKLKRVRDSLNQFVERLHCARHNGMTAYGAIGRIVAGEACPNLAFQWLSAETHDAHGLEAMRDLAERLGTHARELGMIADHPLALVSQTDWSPSWQSSVITSARNLLPACTRFKEAATAFRLAAGLPDVTLTHSSRKALVKLAMVLPSASGKSWQFALGGDGREILNQLQRGCELIGQRENQLSRLSRSYDSEKIDKLDLGDLQRQWEQAQQRRWPRKAIIKSGVRKQLLAVSSGRQKPNCDEDLSLLKSVRDLNRLIGTYHELAGKTGNLWHALETDRYEIELLGKFQTEVCASIATLATDAKTLAVLTGAVWTLLGAGNSLLGPTGSVTATAKTVCDTETEFQAKFDVFITEIHNRSEQIETLELTGIHSACEHIIDVAPRLSAWCAWQKAKAEAYAKGLEPLVVGLETESIKAQEAGEAFEVNYCRWWLNSVVDHDEVLRSFVSLEHERRIQEFRSLDDQITSLTKDYIRARLCAEITGKGEEGKKSEWGILRHEIEKRKRHIPLRQLISSLPTALPRLAPCLLMSPLSIAQYLSADTAAFDLVVFDEASQIPVWDAIGAMARGKQVVVVGDPQQLPPTNFFARSDDDSDNDVEADEALESILDECLGSNLPDLQLSWHYRSRHESLIAFSNHHYYGGALVTFPSPVTDDRAVRSHFVSDGIYEKGGGRINKTEAKALVQHLLTRLKDPLFVNAGYSIGVVTFNSDQQKLVEDLLDEARRGDPTLDTFFDDTKSEPIFVKNLESVQGDERDVMYFSTTFGPDISGKVSMQFGPMNRNGGERRLNVAITRARQELNVFTSLRAEQMDLARTRAIGVRDLKHFLEFADRGAPALAQTDLGSMGGYESPFESSVAQALADRGWRVQAQIGVSGFRVDLGIVNPNAPGRYLAGIECDGATYHQSATARDRDKLREKILTDLGWNIIRIWSTEWWMDPAGSILKVDRRLHELLGNLSVTNDNLLNTA